MLLCNISGLNQTSLACLITSVHVPALPHSSICDLQVITVASLVTTRYLTSSFCVGFAGAARLQRHREWHWHWAGAAAAGTSTCPGSA